MEERAGLTAPLSPGAHTHRRLAVARGGRQPRVPEDGLPGALEWKHDMLKDRYDRVEE